MTSGYDDKDSKETKRHNHWTIVLKPALSPRFFGYAQVSINKEPVGLIRCKTEKEYQWIRDNLTGTQRRK